MEAAAEFMALCAAAPEAIYLKMILADFDSRFREPNIIYEDSESCNACMKNPNRYYRRKQEVNRCHYLLSQFLYRVM